MGKKEVTLKAYMNMSNEKQIFLPVEIKKEIIKTFKYIPFLAGYHIHCGMQ